MNLFVLSYKNLLAKPVNATISLLLLVLSVAMATAILQIKGHISNTMNKNTKAVDMVVGAKGSPIQLVLSAILHIDAPTGNIPFNEAMEVAKNPLVSMAVPISYGDNYKGQRILGTNKSFFELYGATMATGQSFGKPFEVVLGSQVQNMLNLEIGQSFVGSHGLVEDAFGVHEDHPFVVTGILAPTGTVMDHLIITPLESVWEVHEHAPTTGERQQEPHEPHDYHGDAHEEPLEDHREITALLVRFRNPLGMVQMPRLVNTGTNMQAALPNYEVKRVMGLLGIGITTVQVIAFVILLVAGLSIFLSLSQTIRERQAELALLRTYGAATHQLLLSVVLEALWLAWAGALLGWTVGRLGLLLLYSNTRENLGPVTVSMAPSITERYMVLGISLITVLAALLSSLSIFKLNISKTLSDA